MPTRPSFVAVAAAVIVMACTPLRMGESQSALSQLLERQRACDVKKSKGELTAAPDMAECIDTADGLAALAREMAQEAGKPGTNAPNAVFFYRRAATAAWRSQQPKAMQEAITYARSGADLCGGDRSRSEIAPGDCALLGLIPAAVVHDEGMIAFRTLRSEVAAKPAAAQQSAYVAAAPAQMTGASAELNTRLGASAQRAFEGWAQLTEAAPAICRNDVDPTVRGYATVLRQDMTANLKSFYDTMNATMPFGSGYSDADYAGACTPGSGSVGIASMTGRDDLANRTNRAAWCRWQTAQRNAAEICR